MNLDTDFTQLDDDSLFARLESLLVRVGEMQEKDAQLITARQAREVKEKAALVEKIDAEITHYQEVQARAKQDIKRATEKEQSDNPEELAQAEKSKLEAAALLRMYADLYSYRLSSLERAQTQLQQLLKESALSLDDALNDLALNDEQFQALDTEVRTFQAEYLSVYEECKKREDLT